MKTVERILRKIHELKTEINVQDYKPKYSIVEINNMEEWVKCLEWVLEE